MNENKDLFITGDININMLNVETNKHINDYSNMISSYNFTNTVNSATRITNSSQTLIDHFYTNNLSKIHKTSIILTDISDHYGILTTIKQNSHKHSQTNSNQVFYRSYTSLNISNLISDTLVVVQNIENSYNTNNFNINQKFNRFITEMKYLLDTHAPLKKLTRKQKQLSQKPWITKGKLKSIKTRNKLYQKLHNIKFSNIYSTHLTNVKCQI